MNIYVMDESYEDITIFDSYSSLIWTERYGQCGDFQINVYPSTELLDVFRPGRYLQIQDSDTTMIIETVEIKTDYEDGDEMIITGRSLESILDRRVVWARTDIDDTIQNGISKLLSDAIINPSDSNRKIDNFVFNTSTDEDILAVPLKAQYIGDNIYEVLEKLTEVYEIGFKLVLDNTTKKFNFTLFTGEDRTYEQTDNMFVKFSKKFDNLITSNYLNSTVNYKTATLVGGEGEGNARVFTSIGGGAGLSRREMFADGSDLSANGTIALSKQQYINILQDRGRDELAKNQEVQAFDCEIDYTTQFIYGEDYHIGDLVELEDDYGNQAKARVVEFIRSYTTSEISIYPSFKVIDSDLRYNLIRHFRNKNNFKTVAYAQGITTGSLTKKAPTISYAKFSNTAGYEGVVQFQPKIDFTSYKRLHVEGLIECNKPSTVAFYLMTSSSSFTYKLGEYTNLSEVSDINTDFDVSSYNGNYYLGIYIGGNAYINVQHLCLYDY